MEEISTIFNRAFKFIFCRVKLAFTSAILTACGVLLLFTHTLQAGNDTWVALSLQFLPLLICMGVLMSMGVLWVRVYHKEVKGEEYHLLEVLKNSWDLMMTVSYITIAAVLSYLLIWFVLGIFLLLKQIPGVGTLFASILSFAPFLLNLTAILLLLAVFAALFFLVPPLALRGVNKLQLRQTIIQRLNVDLFTNLLHVALAMFPFFLLWSLLASAFAMTGQIFLSSDNTLQATIENFFVMIPYAALLSPGVVFFFHFAAESYSYMMKRLKKLQVN